MLKSIIRVIFLVLGLHFVLHLRVSLRQQFTADIGYLLLASLVMRSGGIHIFCSQWSCLSLSSKGTLMIWTQSFFCFSPVDTGLWVVFVSFCFPKQLKALFYSGERVETSGTGFCSFPKVATVHLPRPPPWRKPSLVSCSAPNLLNNEVCEKVSFCVQTPLVYCSPKFYTLTLVHTHASPY